MPADLDAILKLEVPVIVQIASRSMRMGDVVNLVPGSIVELPKSADDELELLVNNKPVGTGTAVKVGENFGFRVSFIGDLRKRVSAMGPSPSEPAAGQDVATLTESFVSRQ